MSKKLIYIAHPFIRNPEENKKSVLKYIKQVLDEGNIPICTITMWGDLVGEVDEKQIIKNCLKLIDICDEVYMTNDWYNSKGCLIEFDYATKIGKSIRY